MERVTMQRMLGRPLTKLEKEFVPCELFIKGKLNIPLANAVAIAGSRDASDEGKKMAVHIASTLAGKGITVVTGLARGIDRAAHDAAIKAGGKVVSVLGEPLGRIHPDSDRHMLVSQFKPGTPMRPKNFLARNLTMAVLSGGVVIVESKETGGTVHCGWQFIKLGRHVRIWGPAATSGYKWVEQMRKYGCKVIEG